jgi:hypothetical protein
MFCLGLGFNKYGAIKVDRTNTPSIARKNEFGLTARKTPIDSPSNDNWKLSTTDAGKTEKAAQILLMVSTTVQNLTLRVEYVRMFLLVTTLFYTT